MTLAFELEYRGFVVKAFYLEEADQNARIEILKYGEPFKEFLYPAYRIWNIHAHFPEMVDAELSGPPAADANNSAPEQP